MPRGNYLKVMGPLIAHVVAERGTDCRAVVLLPRWGTSKPQLWLDRATVSALWQDGLEIIELAHPDDLRQLVRAGTLDALFSVQPALSDLSAEQVASLRAASVTHGTQWIALPEGFSQDAYLITETESILANWDLVCLTGTRSVAFVESHLEQMAPATARSLRARTAITGYPEFDALATLPTESQSRATYGLPVDTPLVFVATAPRIVPLSVNTWRARGIDMRFRGEGSVRDRVRALATTVQYPTLVPYRTYLDSLRRFADRNGAALVAKTRAKHQDPACLTDTVDYFIEDRSFYPFTTLELMQCCRLYFGFYSNTVSEAVASGVHALTALHMPPDVAHWRPEWRGLSRAMSWGESGLWRTPGIAQVIDGTSRESADALSRLADSRLDDYRSDEEHRANAMREFFNYPCNSSALVLDALASRWN